jgi:alkylated DNA repair protein (DNA oxidative demethylase)
MAMRGVQERPAGLTYRADLVGPAEESSLLDWCRALATEPVVMHGVESRRRVRHFGVHYDAASWRTVPTDPVPDVLLGLREAAASVADVQPTTLAEALVTCYPPGAGIGWHRDAQAFGPVVVGVSLGAHAVMRFQRTAAGGERWVFEQALAPRSVYVLSGAARSAWQHSVPAVKDERWSVTFRQLRGRRDAPPSPGVQG